jgi:hypothetical protein
MSIQTFRGFQTRCITRILGPLRKRDRRSSSPVSSPRKNKVLLVRSAIDRKETAPYRRGLYHGSFGREYMQSATWNPLYYYLKLFHHNRQAGHPISPRRGGVLLTPTRRQSLAGNFHRGGGAGGGGGRGHRHGRKAKVRRHLAKQSPTWARGREGNSLETATRGTQVPRNHMTLAQSFSYRSNASRFTMLPKLNGNTPGLPTPVFPNEFDVVDSPLRPEDTAGQDPRLRSGATPVVGGDVAYHRRRSKGSLAS